MSAKPKFITIEILPGKEVDFKNLIKALSDSRIREIIYEYPYECRDNLKRLLECLPTDIKYGKELSQKVGLIKPFKKIGEKSINPVINFIEKENIKIKDDTYFKNFLPHITKYIILQNNPQSSRFRNSLIKSIYNFVCYVASDNTQYTHHKLTAFICQHLEILEKEISKNDIVHTIKSVLKTKTAKDIYQDQLENQTIQIIDPSDPSGYNVFLKEIE